MTKTTRGVPEGASAIIPRLFCRDVAAEIEFCKAAFGAEEVIRRADPDGRIIHALLKISGAMLMLEGEYPTLPSRCPQIDGTSPVVIYLYLADCDSALEQALKAGARVLVPLQDQFWGDRMGWIMDSEGHVWTVATRIEEISAEERARRWDNTRSSEQRDST
jgi:PhnB protein